MDGEELAGRVSGVEGGEVSARKAVVANLGTWHNGTGKKWVESVASRP